MRAVDSGFVSDLRLICEICGMKWFVDEGCPVAETPISCAGCGGALAPLEMLDRAAPPAWDRDAR